MNELFSIRQSLERGWDVTEKNSGLLFTVLLTIAALQVAGALVDKFSIGMFATAVVIAAGVVFGAGLTVIGLKLAEGERAVYADIIPPLRTIIRFFFSGLFAGIAALLPLAVAFAGTMWQVASAMGYAQFYSALSAAQANPDLAGDTINLLVAHLNWVGVAVGLIGVVLSAYIGLRYMMARFAAVDGCSVRESLRESAVMTRGVKWRLLLFIVTLIFLNLLGVAIFLIGLLITIPVSLIASVDVYLKLKAHSPAPAAPSTK